MYYGVYNIKRNKVYEKNITEDKKWEIEVQLIYY